MALGMEVNLGPDHIVQDRDPTPIPKHGQSPQFSVHVYCGQMAQWIKMPLGTEVGLDPNDSSPKKDTVHNFWPMSIVAKTAVFIRTPLGTDVGLSLGDIV